PWEFWRTTQFRSFEQIAPFELRPSDDTGRASLSALGFRLLGGVAPYLPLWLPYLAFIPLAFWIMVECIRCDEGWAGGVFLILLASSAYFLESLTLPYSAVGFHLLASLLVVPVSFLAFGPRPARLGFWVRVVAVAVAIHGATLCRSSSVAMIPLVATLLLIALWRMEDQSPLPKRVMLSLVVLLVIAAPRALAPSQAHEVWIGVWEGLGDFDRERGHEWSDFSARVALDREGYVMARRGPYWTPETEAIFRRLVLQDVKADPSWYARILFRRVIATLTQWRLWPTARETGLSYFPAEHPSEGYLETYYNFVTTADGFTALGRRVEAPLWLMWIGPLWFLASLLRGNNDRKRRRFAVVLSFALSALLMPVVVTTLSGIEAQALVLGYLLCAAFMLSDLAAGLGLKVNAPGFRRRLATRHP
ncbi:MAG: hypothetical protein ABI565_11980, partial [Vicinamibacteria bacterium]